MEIQIISPFNQGVHFGLNSINENTKKIVFTITKKEDGSFVKEFETENFDTWTTVDFLLNGINYNVFATAFDGSGKEIEKTVTRVFQTNYIPGTCVNYISPCDQTTFPEGIYFGSPSLVKMPDGTLFAANDLFWYFKHFEFTKEQQEAIVPAKELYRSKVYFSKDGGKSWCYASTIKNCMWGQLFEFKGNLYMFAIGAKYPDKPINGSYKPDVVNEGDQRFDIVLYESSDMGKTWGKSCNITGRFNVNHHFHKGSTPIVEHNGRLFAAFEGPKNPETGFSVTVASVCVDDDIMNESNWTVASPFLEYNPKWKGTISRYWPYMMEESSVVVNPEGKINVFARYNSVYYPDEHINYNEDGFGLRAVVLDVDENDFSKPLTFNRMQDFIGSLSKFAIKYDEISEKYYSVVNRVINDMCCQRNILTLVSSDDLNYWRLERDLINLEDIQWHQNCREAGFHTADFSFDGDDIIAVCRTAVNDCYNFHNSNMMTFHRFKNFRNKNYILK